MIGLPPALRSLFGSLFADERVRFLLVGGVNTVLAYVLFVLFYTLGLAHVGALALAYLIATLVAFVLHRRFTFRVSGPLLLDFVRFESVYVVMFIINGLGLVLLVDVAGWPALLAQALLVVVTTVVSYVGHKLFSFRRRAPGTPSLDPAPAAGPGPSPLPVLKTKDS